MNGPSNGQSRGISYDFLSKIAAFRTKLIFSGRGNASEKEANSGTGPHAETVTVESPSALTITLPTGMRLNRI